MQDANEDPVICSKKRIAKETLALHSKIKRRKVTRKIKKLDDEKIEHFDDVRKRKNPIKYMPTEIIQMIFKNISYRELSSTVRLVNRRFRVIAEDILNSAFKKLENKLQFLIKITRESLNLCEDDMEIRCISKLLTFLEIVNKQYEYVLVSIWRNVYNKYYKTPQSSMYGGLIIDLYEDFIDIFSKCPSKLYSFVVLKNYALPPEVTRIVDSTKCFCQHYFDNFSETLLPGKLYGCKLIDILNCLKSSNQIVSDKRIENDYLIANYTFKLDTAWFITLSCSRKSDLDYSEEKIHAMEMRIRRIVTAHNSMFIQQEEFTRELMLRETAANIAIIKPPASNIYSGYGRNNNRIFLYGVMNDEAHFLKFNPIGETRPDLLFMRNPHESTSDPLNEFMFQLPNLGLEIKIDVRCPLALAPLNFLRTIENTRIPPLPKTNRKSIQKEAYLKFHFICRSAHWIRLPSRFQYSFDLTDNKKEE